MAATSTDWGTCKVECLRVDGTGELQTAVFYYSHPEGGRSVTVIGTNQVGETGYYAQLRRAIGQVQAHGAAVHFEVPISPLADRERVRQDEQDVVDQLERAEILHIRRAGVLGWVHRREGLRPSEDWHAHDISLLELIRRADIDVARSRADLACAKLDWSTDDRRGPARYRLWMAMALRSAARRRLWTQRRTAESPAVVSYRIQPALNVVDRTDGDVVLVWDVATVPALVDALAARGFVGEQTRWHSVGRLPGRAAAVADLIVGRRPRTEEDTALARRPAAIPKAGGGSRPDTHPT